MKHGLKIVKISRDDSKLRAVERVHDQFRMAYRSWHMLGSKEALTLWLKSLEDYSVDTIHTTMNSILKGKTEFNSNPPTPMQFARLCENNTLEPSYSWLDVMG